MDYEKKYKEALSRAKEQLEGAKVFDYKEGQIAHDIRTTTYAIFPELKESDDERIRKGLVKAVSGTLEGTKLFGTDVTRDEALAWLEKQGKETSWKPSKEEMDVLYGLAYITNQYDEHKEEVITRFYQDLKREFFNGSSYENMFPNTEDGVRRRSTIQVLEYARSLDTYNQYGKADIDKNIAWLEKQGEQKLADKVIKPKFHEGEWVVFNNRHDSVYQVEKIENYEYTLRHFLGGSMPLSFSHEDMIRAWTVKDVRDGDVLAYVTDEEDLWIMIYWSLYEPYEGHVHYHALLVNDKFSDKGTCCICINDLKPATKEQRDLLFQKMKETGYEWSDKDRKLIKIVK